MAMRYSGGSERKGLLGSSLNSFEEAALSAIGSGSPGTNPNVPRTFQVVSFSITVGGFVGRPQYIVELADDAPSGSE